jgi:PEP-CTERM motif
MLKILNFRSLFAGMTLLFGGTLGVALVAAPAGGFSFTQSGNITSIQESSPGIPPGATQSFQSSVLLNGSFDGSDLNDDGILACLSQIGTSGCEITSFSAQVQVSLSITTSPVPNIGYPGGTRVVDINYQHPPSMTLGRPLGLTYTLGDPNSLAFANGDAVGINGYIETRNNMGSFKFGQFSGSLNSPLIVSGDSTPIPEPTTLSGLALAGVAGAWWKRRSLRQTNAS